MSTGAKDPYRFEFTVRVYLNTDVVLPEGWDPLNSFLKSFPIVLIVLSSSKLEHHILTGHPSPLTIIESCCSHSLAALQDDLTSGFYFFWL